MPWTGNRAFPPAGVMGDLVLGVNPSGRRWSQPQSTALPPFRARGLGLFSEKMVGVRGFEPPAPASRTQCSTRLSYTPTLARNGVAPAQGPAIYRPTLMRASGVSGLCLEG